VTGGASRVALGEQVLLFGSGAAGERLGAELRARGWRAVAVLVSPSAAASGQLDRLRAGALASCELVALHDRVRPHAPVADSQAIAAGLAGRRLDALVALGGGKVVDTAKGVAVLLAEGGRLEDHCSVFTPPDRYLPRELPAPKLPLIAVPTTLAGAEMTPGGGATDDRGVKRTFWDPKLVARLVAYDPEVLGATPADVLATTGMNALAHCAEGLYSRIANPISTALALEATRALAAALPAAVLPAPAGPVAAPAACEEPGPFSAGAAAPAGTLAALGEAAAMAGMVIANARVGLHHAICHVLGGRFGVPHGVANAIMLPPVLRFNLEATLGAQRRFAEALAGAEAAEDPPEAVRRFRDRLGVPARLRDAGLDRRDLDRVAADLMQERGLYFNPRRIEEPSQVREVLEWAW
jgi:alcohol dehydrogenase